MSKVEHVWVQIRGPQGHDEGLVECGYYKILEDGSLQMCREDGNTVVHTAVQAHSKHLGKVSQINMKEQNNVALRDRS